MAASGTWFEYVGGTALTVFGAVTGTPYRFTHSGMRLALRSRDVAAMAGVPSLRPR